MMNYHQSRLRGRWEPWYYDFYNYLKDGFISEYATRGQRRAWRRTCPTICDLGRCPLQKELLNIIENRRSEDLVEDKVQSEPTLGSDHSRCEDAKAIVFRFGKHEMCPTL
ncbi:hypothetical protein QL285_097473 [Trifolium repens]|nr:hypothetical protein QL285_098844 [Trifolium repens]KAK2350460.1 hypothetical protein QL285_098183 [Trifolium repens]KAK2351181.1 hypothetical protein QL285_097473 [Trifolium repens]